MMKPVLTIWRDLDPATAPDDDASLADVLGAVVSAVDVMGWMCGVIPERAGGYRGAVWSGLPPVWIYTSWAPTEAEALLFSFVDALKVSVERG